MRRLFLLFACVLLVSLYLIMSTVFPVSRGPVENTTFFRFGNVVKGTLLVHGGIMGRTKDWRTLFRYPCRDHDTFDTGQICLMGGMEGRLSVGFTGVNHLGQRVDRFEQEQLLRKPYRKSDDFRVEYVTMWVRCEFPRKPPAVDRISVLDWEFRVDPARQRPLRKGTVGVCARAPFGNSQSVRMFVDFYRDQWMVEDIIVYDVGLGSIDYYDVVDLYPFLREQYQSLAHDVLYLSWAMGQNWLRLDCELRMRIRGVDWVFYPDFDEFLFPPRGQLFQPLGIYLQKFEAFDWLSVGSLMVSENVTCKNGIGEFSREQQKEHEKEWMLADARGPFECTEDFVDTRTCPSYRGRRKIFARNSEKRYFGMVEVHQLWSCAYGDKPEKSHGMDLNAEFHPYIRHIRWLNHHKCK